MAVFGEAWSKGLRFRLSQGFRTPQEQAVIYAKGRDSKGKVIKPHEVVTNAKPWASWHNYGLAFDVVLLDEKGRCVWDRKADLNEDHKADLDQFVLIAKKYGFDWGGDFKSFKDYPHFEKPMNLTITKAKELAMNGTAVGGYIVC